MKLLLRSRAFRKFRRDSLAVACLGIIVFYVVIAAAVRLGVFEALGAFHDQPIVTVEQDIAFYTGPSGASWQHWLGTDRQGRSILVRAIYSINVAISVGLMTALLAVGIGSILGAIAGYYGGRVDDFVVWIYSTVESIPYLLLLLVLSYSAGLVFGRGSSRSTLHSAPPSGWGHAA